MLRSIFVLAIVAFGALNVVRGPFYSLLLYLWIAYFRPETWLWDPSLYLSLDLSWVTGIVLLASSVLGRVRWRFDTRTLLLVLFVLQDAVSTFTSAYFDFSYPYWQDFIRFAIVTYLISVLVDDRKKLRLVLMVIALSVGIEAAKQGWAQLVLAPGAKNLNGVTVLGDENETAVGLFMLVPILGALAATAATRWERYFHRFVAGGVIYRAIVTYSRGGFLTALAIGAVYLLRSKNKFRSLLAIGVLSAVIVPVLPSQFWGRMSTLTADQDQRTTLSEGRTYFWGVALQMAAAHPVLGVGHNAFIAAFNSFDASRGEYGQGRAAHSSWFGTLADLGYPGLLLLLSNIGVSIAACERVRRLARARSDLADLAAFASAIEIGILAFVVGGTFVTFQYNEVIWHTIGLSAALAAIASSIGPVTTPVTKRVPSVPFLGSPQVSPPASLAVGTMKGR